MRKASITPINRYVGLFVFEERSKIDSCVLSPNSAIAMVMNGTTKSSMIFYPSHEISFQIYLGYN